MFEPSIIVSLSLHPLKNLLDQNSHLYNDQAFQLFRLPLNHNQIVSSLRILLRFVGLFHDQSCATVIVQKSDRLGTLTIKSFTHCNQIYLIVDKSLSLKATRILVPTPSYANA